jgi:hypothetical protein
MSALKRNHTTPSRLNYGCPSIHRRQATILLLSIKEATIHFLVCESPAPYPFESCRMTLTHWGRLTLVTGLQHDVLVMYCLSRSTDSLATHVGPSVVIIGRCRVALVVLVIVC